MSIWNTYTSYEFTWIYMDWSGTKYHNYFSAPRYYCVETICASCGVVLLWGKFAKAEGAAKILWFFENVYPDPASHLSYIASDKGCAPC